MKVKELQAELTRMGVEFPADAKKAELEAMVVRAHGVETGMPHLITEEDLTENPELVGEGVKVGDVVILPIEEEIMEESPVEPEATPEAPVEAPAEPEVAAPVTETPALRDGEYRLKGNLKRNGALFPIGSTIVLTKKEAQELIEAGVI